MKLSTLNYLIREWANLLYNNYIMKMYRLSLVFFISVIIFDKIYNCSIFLQSCFLICVVLVSIHILGFRGYSKEESE